MLDLLGDLNGDIGPVSVENMGGCRNLPVKGFLVTHTPEVRRVFRLINFYDSRRFGITAKPVKTDMGRHFLSPLHLFTPAANPCAFRDAYNPCRTS